MTPDELLKIAKKMPGKFGLDDYRDTIVLLRDKSYSWRDIAEFLREQGIEKDYSTIFRYMMTGNPIFDNADSALDIGGQWYESQGGRPIHPYLQGLFITVKGKMRSILLEHPEQLRSTWCECQFRLNSPPNRIWLKQLHEELAANFKPERPHHVMSRLGFDLKFEADIMALDCHIINLRQNFDKVSAVMARTNKFFADNKSLWLDLSEKIEARDQKVLELYNCDDCSSAEILEEHAEGYAKNSKSLAEDFAALPVGSE